MNNKGVTLIELVVVAAVVAILMVALGMTFEGWMGKYRIESFIRTFHTDLMHARLMAMHRNRFHFVTLAAKEYTVTEDTDPAPDGNTTLEAGVDDEITRVEINPQYPFQLTWSNIGETQIDFNTDGLRTTATDKTVCIFTDFDLDNDSDYSPDYDCLIITTTRVNLGQLQLQDTAGGNCDTNNCVER